MINQRSKGLPVMGKPFFILILFFFASVAVVRAQKKTSDLTQFVDPFIGVRDQSSNCVIGPQLPFGSVNPSPQTPGGNHDGYSPDFPIRGFGQLHVSGTGWGKYGQMLVSPQIGLNVTENGHDSSKEGEIATAYEYAVVLKRYGIKVAVTPQKHSAFYKFTFPKSDSAHLIFDITHNIPMDIVPEVGGKVLDGEVHFSGTDGKEIVGYANYIGGFGDGAYKVYFCARINKKPKITGTWLNGKLHPEQQSEKLIAVNDRVGAYFGFETTDGEEVEMQIGISFKSIAQAKFWLDDELKTWDYALKRKEAKEIWNRQLRKIEVVDNNVKNKKLFYTALYHTLLMPRDRTNDMQGFAKDQPVWDDHYAVWDTWRTMYPLQVLINPDMVTGTVNSFIKRFEKNHMVKDGYIAGNDMMGEQGGNDVDNIIADAYLKGIKGVDWHKAYKIIKFNADQERLGSWGWTKDAPYPDQTNTYKTLGYVAAGRMSSSMTLEYAYNDFCIAQMAKGLGKIKDYNFYLLRSRNWLKLWNPDLESKGFKGFIAPKTAEGNFVDIDPLKDWGPWGDYFYEGNTWTYSYFMPHDFKKLIEISGGPSAFTLKLENAIQNNLISFYNEPAFLISQAFHYAGRSDLASFNIRKLMKDRFTEKGYPENDDSGAMSSWYVFSAMGIFPNAGQDLYYLNGPSFKQVKVHLANGKTIDIIARDASEKNIYVKSVTINGKLWNKFWFNQKDIQNGAKIIFNMTSQKH